MLETVHFVDKWQHTLHFATLLLLIDNAASAILINSSLLVDKRLHLKSMAYQSAQSGNWRLFFSIGNFLYSENLCLIFLSGIRRNCSQFHVLEKFEQKSLSETALEAFCLFFRHILLSTFPIHYFRWNKSKIVEAELQIISSIQHDLTHKSFGKLDRYYRIIISICGQLLFSQRRKKHFYINGIDDDHHYYEMRNYC